MTTVPDGRIAYGANCRWWGSIGEVGTSSRGSGLPCCPRCGGMLFEMESEGEWWSGVDAYEAGGHPGYRAFIEWLRGRCYPTFDAAKAAYDATH